MAFSLPALSFFRLELIDPCINHMLELPIVDIESNLKVRVLAYEARVVGMLSCFITKLYLALLII